MGPLITQFPFFIQFRARILSQARTLISHYYVKILKKIPYSKILVNHLILIRVQGLISCVLSSKDSSKPKRVVLASTKNRLLHFIGPESKESIDRVFSGYSSGGNVIEFPSTAIFSSKLILSPVMVENEARVFAWSCMSGLEGRLKIFLIDKKVFSEVC